MWTDLFKQLLLGSDCWLQSVWLMSVMQIILIHQNPKFCPFSLSSNFWTGVWKCNSIIFIYKSFVHTVRMLLSDLHLNMQFIIIIIIIIIIC